VFRFGLAWSAVAFVACALAPTYGALLGARVLQGVGAALVLGCGPALATGLFPEALRVRALAAYATGLALGGAIGPLLGGVLVEAFGWAAVYASRAPLALVALALARALPDTSRVGAREPFDSAGAVLLALAVATGVMALNRAPAPIALGLAALAIACGGGFLWRSARCAHPIIDLGLFRRPGFAGINLANLLVNLAGFAVMLLAPFWLARIAALPATTLGLVLAGGPVGAMAGSALGGWCAGRYGARAVALAGGGLSAAGLLLVAAWAPGMPVAATPPALLLHGVGLGMFTLAYTDVVTATMRREDRGVAGSLSHLTRTLGVVVAASVLTLGFGAAQAGLLAAGATVGDAFAGAFRRVFLLVGVLPLAALALLRRAR
jgi:MFS family permease